jgi:SAM-dependent methyltransferase
MSMTLLLSDKELETRLLQKVPNWRTYKLSIKTHRGTFSLSWDSVEELAFYSMFQIGLGNESVPSLQHFYDNHSRKRQEEWSRNENLGAYNIPENANVLDIGSGVGINSLILSFYAPSAKITLLDKNNGWKDVAGLPQDYLNGYDEDGYVFYNDTNLTKEAMENSKIENVKFIVPEDEWEQYDLITSTWSYAWHYPLDIYWEKVLNYLKPGGMLMLDIWHDKDIQKISEAMKSEPEMSIHPESGSERCLWVRQ